MISMKIEFFQYGWILKYFIRYFTFWSSGDIYPFNSSRWPCVHSQDRVVKYSSISIDLWSRVYIWTILETNVGKMSTIVNRLFLIRPSRKSHAILMARPPWKSHAIELKSEIFYLCTDNAVECYTQLKAATINGSLPVWWLWHSNWWSRRQERDSGWPPQCSAQHRTRTGMQCTTPDSNRNAVHINGLEPECSAQQRTQTGMQCTTTDSNRNAVHNTGLEPDCSAKHRTRTGMQCTTPDSNQNAVHNTGLEPECSAQHRTRTGM